MGLRTMTGKLDGGKHAAVLYCSTAMVALPWIFDDEDDANDFVMIHGDIRLDEDNGKARYEAWQAAKVRA